MRDPEQTIRAHAEVARHRILSRILDPAIWAYLVELAVERATSIGAREYGDRAWGLSRDEIQIEGFQEIADLIFYMGVEFDLDAEAGRPVPL
jgi:hypothetical protein